MPVVRIFVDETYWESCRLQKSGISEKIQTILVDGLGAVPESCQILFVSALMPQFCPPIYVDLQYRASAKRTKSTVQPVVQKISELLNGTSGGKCRIRAFAIDVTTLTAAETMTPG